VLYQLNASLSPAISKQTHPHITERLPEVKKEGAPTIELKLSAHQVNLGIRAHNIISGIKASERIDPIGKKNKKSQEMKQ